MSKEEPLRDTGVNPDFAALVADLRVLRRVGLVRLRSTPLPALREPAARSGPEALLRAAVAGLGGGKLAEAADYTFGLVPGTRDWPPQDRRRRAAEVYGVSVERFRKHQENLVVEQVVEQILRIGAAGAADPADTADPADPAESVESVQSADPTGPARLRLGTRIQLWCPVGSVSVPVTVHVASVELLTAIDVLVSTTNSHLEPSRTFAPTIAGCLRNAAAVRDPTGRIVDDVVDREIRAWLDRNGGVGTTVRPGTVVPTSSGALAGQGIRRIYHAAVATPRPSTHEYHVATESVVRTVREVFATARRERAELGVPLSSLCFPLIGAGRGRMPAQISAEVLWWALEEELLQAPDWRIHLVVRRADRASMLLDLLRGVGAVVA